MTMHSLSAVVDTCTKSGRQRSWTTQAKTQQQSCLQRAGMTLQSQAPQALFAAALVPGQGNLPSVELRRITAVAGHTLLLKSRTMGALKLLAHTQNWN